VHIETTTVLPAHLRERFCELYRDGFVELDKRAAARQSLTDEEFVDEMSHPSVVKWIAWNEDEDEPIALMFMATDLTIVPWISLPYYQHRFPEHYERKAVYYYGGLVVHPDRRGGAVVKALLTEGWRYVIERDAVVAFDCCSFNADVMRLPEVIERVGRRMTNVEATELDVQHYYAYEIKEAV
jgi:hypothetical protein